MNKVVIKELIRTAIKQCEFSYTPYSHFCVGAALLTKSNKIYTGCNIENSAYSPSICAERTAIFKAVSEGVKEFQAICIVGGENGKIENFCPPCGVCRQVMLEFCDKDFPIILARNTEDYCIYKLSELIPFGFALKGE